MASVKMAATQALADPDSVPPTAKPDDAQVPEFLKKIAKQIGLSSPFVVHVIFVLLWTFWLLNARDSEMSYAFSTLVRERILYSELLPSEDEVATSFYDLSSLENVRQFMRGPLLDGLFGDQISRAWGPFDQGWVNDQARMVGAARIRQIRAATNSCAVSLLRVLTPTCYPSLSDGKRRIAPLYGADLGGGMRRVYKYVPPARTDVPFIARLGAYLPGGYVADLPARKLHAAEVMQQLDLDHFLSIAETRAVVIDFSLYNANINTFCIVRLTFEHPAMGGITPHADFRTVRLLPYEGDYGDFQFMLDGLVITYVALLQLLRTRAFRVARRMAEEQGTKFSYTSYFSQKWVFLDWTFIVIFWCILSSKYYVRSVMKDLSSQAPLDPNMHYPLFDAAQAAQVETNLLAVGSLMVFIKTFKYISHLPVIKRLLDAVNATYSELLSYIAIFMVMMFAFAMSFHIAFGLHSADFAGVGITFITLMRFALGDVDIDHILGMNRILGTVLSLAYTFIMYLILIGIGVSILVSAYARQPVEHERIKQFIQEAISRRNRLLHASRQDLKELQATLRKAAKIIVRDTREQIRAATATDLRAGTGKRRTTGSRAKLAERVKAAQAAALGVHEESIVEEEWIAQPGVSSGGFEDPMAEAEIAFGYVQDSLEQRAIADTQRLTDNLKTMYLEVLDEQRKQEEQLTLAASALRAIRDENYAMVRAMRAKGIELGPELDPEVEFTQTGVPPEGLASVVASLSVATGGATRKMARANFNSSWDASVDEAAFAGVDDTVK